MKLICPKCSSKVDIKSDSRYLIYKCGECNYKFRGIHAEISELGYFLDQFIPFSANFCISQSNETCCPYCWERIFGTPSRCCNCCKDLPRSYAEQDEPSPPPPPPSPPPSPPPNPPPNPSIKIQNLKIKGQNLKNWDSLADDILKELNVSKKAELYFMLISNQEFINKNNKIIGRIKYWFEQNKNKIDKEIYNIFMENFNKI